MNNSSLKRMLDASEWLNDENMYLFGMCLSYSFESVKYLDA